MKQRWLKLAQRLDGLSLRERIMVFAAVAVVLLALVNALLIEPQFAKQKQLALNLKQSQDQIAQVQAEIQRRARERQADPDAATRVRLQRVARQTSELQDALLELQKGLVAPDSMARLLDDLLKRNGRLSLVSLKSLPPVNVNEPVAEPKAESDKAARDKVQATARIGAVYKHGVEIAVQGEYLEMLNYLMQVEALPWRIFWARARLEANEYPKATLTLTLYTMSLEKKWMNL